MYKKCSIHDAIYHILTIGCFLLGSPVHNVNSDAISIGQLSKRTGIAVSALHFYERKGLITSFRNTANHRQYPRHTIRIVSLILVGQRTEFSLEEILLELQALPNQKK